MASVERVWPVDVSRPVLPAPDPPRPIGAPRASDAAWWAGAAVLAAAVAVDPAGLRPFTSLRWFLVSACLSAAALVVGRRSSASRAAGLPRWIVATGSVVVVAMAVSAALVGDPATAWLGHPQRHLGVVAWCVFALAAGTGAVLAGRGRTDLRILSLAALAAALVTGAAAVADLAGWAPLGASFAGGRIGGLSGQPTTLGALAVLLLPVVAVAPADRRLRALAVAGLFAAILGSQTRGAVLGVVAVALVSLPALPRRPRTAQVAAGLLALLALGASPAGDRLWSSADSGRIDEWALAADVVAAHPVLGVGPEGYRIAVVDALDPGYVERHGRDVVIDRAHAAPLDVAASGGVVAGVGYVALVGGVALATWRLQRRAPWSMPAAAGAGATGLLAAGFVAFPTPEVDAVAWLFAGVALAAAAAPRSRPPTTRPRSGRRAGAAAVLLVVCVAAGVTDVAADRRLADARSLADAGRVADAVAAADRATGLRPDLVDAWYVAAQVAASGPTVLDLDAGIARAAEGRRRSPDDPALRTLHASLVAERALRTGLPQDVALAGDVLRSALAHDSTEPRLLALAERLHLTSPGRP